MALREPRQRRASGVEASRRLSLGDCPYMSQPGAPFMSLFFEIVIKIRGLFELICLSVRS